VPTAIGKRYGRGVGTASGGVGNVRFTPESGHYSALHQMSALCQNRLPPETTTRLRPDQLPDQAARQLPDLSTSIRVEPSSTGDTSLLGGTANNGPDDDTGPERRVRGANR